jgi:dTMP kinase
LAREGLERLRGKFVVFDGVDGSGKGVQIRLLTEKLTAAGVECVTTRDPGGTPIGDRIRHVLLDYDLSEMDVRCEALLFMASRAQLAGQILEPAIAEAKKCLIVDRYVSATCAYQGAAGHDTKKVLQLAKFAIGKTWPDLTIILDVPHETAAQRTARKTQAQRKKEQMYKKRSLEGHPTLFQDVHTDAMEARPAEFHQRVRQLFLELPSYYPSPVVIVDGQGTEQEVHAGVMEALANASF